MSRLVPILSVWALAAVCGTGAAGMAMLGGKVLNPGLASAGEMSAAPVSQGPLRPAVAFSTPNAAIAELLGRSPFDESRRAFSRTIVIPAPPPPPPKLLGISSSDGARSAMVEWPATGKTETLKVGAETSIGAVAKIGDSDIVFGTGEQAVTISMFQ